MPPMEVSPTKTVPGEPRPTDEAVRRAQRALRALSLCNQATVRATQETTLLGDVCRAIVGMGYRLCWVGMAEHDERRTVRPAAQAGYEEGYLSTVDLVWSDTDRGRGPVGTAIRLGHPAVVRDLHTDPAVAIWRVEAERRGYASLAAFPLQIGGATLGAVAIYASEPNAFDDEEMALLRELAEDLAFGIEALRGRARRAEMEAQLMQADRLVSMGMLAAGVAHEINNPLAYLVAGLDVLSTEMDRLSRELPPGTLLPLQQALREVGHGADRIEHTVRDLKTFSRTGEEPIEPLDLRRVLESSIRMAFGEIRYRARLTVDLGPIPMVEASESRLGQILLNLLINAAQAIPEGAVDQNEIRVATFADAHGRAVVEIRDTGVGIPRENLERIFEPFFTTKPPGVGTGLGLSICKGLVAAMGGDITVESQAGGGSVFRLRLPPAAPDRARPRSGAVAGRAPRAARVLIVDDEALVCKAVARALAEHEVATETRAAAALERIGSGERFDLVICDLMMPEMTGMDFHERLSSLAPDLARRTVFITGGAFTPKAREFLDRVKGPVVEKPFDGAALRKLVRGFLR